MKFKTFRGTEVFKNLTLAIKYYKPYGYNSLDVFQKLKNKEISLTKPKENGYWNDEGRFILIVE